MKSRIAFFLFLLLSLWQMAVAQKTTHDLTTFTAPAGWKLERRESNLAYSKVDESKGIFAILMVYRSADAGADSKKNFDSYWRTLIQPTTNAGKAEMEDPGNVGEWKLETGIASYEKDGIKGAAMLICATGFGRAINIIVLTNAAEYQQDISAFISSMSFTKPPVVVAQPPKVESTPGNFQFTSTNFDDGWTATAESDWVRVSKGASIVRVHFPNKIADEYDSVLRNQTLKAWNALVAPHLSNVEGFQIKSIQSFESIHFAEASATDRTTGKRSYIVLFKKISSTGSGKYLEFVTDSKATFEREFMPYRNEEFGWEKLEQFQYRNKFAVAERDLVGTWTTSNYASLSYYYVNGGGFAGATATSTADEYKFLGGGQYTSDHAGASGNVGNQRFSRQVYKGTAKVDPWKMNLTNRFQGQPEAFDCYFEAIKGGRILVMRDRLNTNFFLVKRA